MRGENETNFPFGIFCNLRLLSNLFYREKINLWVQSFGFNCRFYDLPFIPTSITVTWIVLFVLMWFTLKCITDWLLIINAYWNTIQDAWVEFIKGIFQQFYLRISVLASLFIYLRKVISIFSKFVLHYYSPVKENELGGCPLVQDVQHIQYIKCFFLQTENILYMPEHIVCFEQNLRYLIYY